MAATTLDDVIAEVNAWAEHGVPMPADLQAGFDALDTRGRPEIAFDATMAAKWIARSRKAREAAGAGGSATLGTNLMYGAAGLALGALIGFGLSRLGR